MNYGFSKKVNLSFEDVLKKTTDELKKEGFGVLTEIDVKETLKKKLDVNFNKYKILGACNPPIAFEALKEEMELGLLLPCNVIVYENEGKTNVSIFNPTIMTKIIDNPGLTTITEKIKEKLLRVINNIN
jgi:uncharacterized protein (DUF302 family)